MLQIVARLLCCADERNRITTRALLGSLGGKDLHFNAYLQLERVKIILGGCSLLMDEEIEVLRVDGELETSYDKDITIG